jgi:photosystem II stability/assembly factor-like uncharacterized protein
MKKLVLSLFVLLSTMMHAQSWEWLTPIHTNSDLRGSSFLNDQVGCVVSTTDGDLIRTFDGGDTWQAIAIPAITLNLYDVEYLSEDTILVCGNTGNIWRSIDGGSTWSDMNPPTTQWLYRMYFVNMNLGFASGFGGTILRTTDGGTTWTVIANPATDRLWDMYFANENVGYVVGWSGNVLKTVDAGLTWTALNASATTDFKSLYFLDEQNGWICGEGGTILKTTNGGTSWSSQYNTGQQLNYIQFDTPLIGWACGDSGASLRTINGGSSWTTNPITSATDFYAGSKATNGTSFLFGNGRMYRSTNSGSTWELIKNAVTRSKNTGIFFTDDMHGTVVGYVGVLGEGSNQGGINVTSDGGKTWEIKSQSSSGGWYDVHYPTDQTGYATAFNQLAKTTNGGVTWTYTQPTTNTGLVVYFKDVNTGFVGSPSNASGMCTTTNGGSSFSCTTSLVPSAIAFRDANNGIAIPGPSGTAKYRTTDGGLNWTVEPGGIGGTGIYFYDQNFGYITSIGSVFKTVDGGETWTEYFFGSDKVIGIHFYTPQLGYFVTEYANVYRTTDGGETWELFQMSSNGAYGLNACFTENYCYLSGYGGSVFRTDFGCDTFSAGEISAPQDWCETQSGYLFIEPVVGALSYDWDLPDGWVINSGSNYVNVTAGPSDGLATVTITNSCGIQYSTSYQVNVTELVENNIVVSGPSVVCSNGEFVYEISEDANATDYFWQWTSALTATAEGNTLTITAATGQGSIYARSENECSESELEIVPITLGTVSDVTFVPEDDTLCTGSIVTLSGGLPAGGVYSGPGVNNGVIDLTGFPDGPTQITFTSQEVGGCPGVATANIEVISVLDHPANFNGDCVINEQDVDVLLQSFGCLQNCGVADLSGDGIVGVDDIILLMFWIQ